MYILILDKARNQFLIVEFQVSVSWLEEVSFGQYIKRLWDCLAPSQVGTSEAPKTESFKCTHDVHIRKKVIVTPGVKLAFREREIRELDATQKVFFTLGMKTAETKVCEVRALIQSPMTDQEPEFTFLLSSFSLFSSLFYLSQLYIQTSGEKFHLPFFTRILG